MKKFNKTHFTIIILVVLLIILSYIFQNYSKIGINSNEQTNAATSNLKKVAGLNEEVRIGNLSFQLTSVNLKKLNPNGHNLSRESRFPKSSYELFWNFIAVNNGDRIENVSNCGILLFEDGSQYNFDASAMAYEITGQCKYTEMVPGSRIELYSTFYFSNSSDKFYVPEEPIYWVGTPKAWEEVPGSKIIYFSQQKQGLVKYSIDKREIIDG